ncbi:hypothetical protein [Algoriphagus sp. CAU 1675]|uniref:hypothetical protein n=1 Tax=Algoriphagus sp. CAU 1675 TaxID=3032597 RepID=UPI0023DC6201|nr:hypothetical protein [Algoriphagus sp. CAU 1675]MDF2156239.1 hypothetical protein [Algoriphagus sp. CAU 1675]
MKRRILKTTLPSFTLFLLALMVSSCVDTLKPDYFDVIESEKVVYSNDFGELDLAGFENGRLFIWRGDTIAGYYRNEEVAVNLNNLPPHNYLKITFEILIHDSWDGNPNDGEISGPDYWYMGYDDTEVFRTTFSNSPCESTYCLYQSYPNSYFRQNRPKTGATQTNLPGLCSFGAFNNYTTRYKISKIIEHNNDYIRIYAGGDLKQTNAIDPVCDESWSISGVEVVAFQVI